MINVTGKPRFFDAPRKDLLPGLRPEAVGDAAIGKLAEAAFEEVFAELQATRPQLRTRYVDLAARYLFEPDALYRDIGFRCLLVPSTSATMT